MSAPQKYKVTAVIGKRPWKPSGEDVVKTIYYDLDVEGVGKCSLGLPPADPEPQVGSEIFAILTPQEGYPPKLVIPKQGKGGGGGGWKGKSPEELRQERANSSVIRAAEFYAIPPEHRPPFRDFIETAAKIDTALGRMIEGKAVVEP